MSWGSAVEYQADEQAGVARLSWPQSSRRAGRCRAAHLAIIKQMIRQVSRGSAGEYQADEQAGVERIRCEYQAVEQEGVAGLTGDYQADEQAGVARVSWRL